MGFAFEAGRRARKSRNRAQKVVLASATFDPDGKVMLTTDGMFPCREITDSYHERVSQLLESANLSLSMIDLTMHTLCSYGSSVRHFIGTASVALCLA
jgi:hypothetical protein